MPLPDANKRTFMAANLYYKIAHFINDLNLFMQIALAKYELSIIGNYINLHIFVGLYGILNNASS